MMALRPDKLPEAEARMAQKVQVLLVDDLDGSDAETTVRFGLDDLQYEIDLNAVHAKELREALACYVGRARKISGMARPTTQRHHGVPVDEPASAEIREWARENGIEIKDRGRVPKDIVARYRAAVGKLAVDGGCAAVSALHGRTGSRRPVGPCGRVPPFTGQRRRTRRS